MATSVLTDAEVKEVIDTDIGDLTAFRTVAAELVEYHLGGTTLSASLKKEVERYLAAHFVAQRERQISSEGMLESSVSYAGKYGMGLDFTQYGQQAMAIDPTGKLSSANRNKRPIKVDVL